MLVLTRGRGEKIVIMTPTGDVVLTVTEVRPNRVNLGVEAPAGLKIDRKPPVPHPATNRPE